MNYIECLFKKNEIILHKNKIGNYYPGACDQCSMFEAGKQTIIYGLTPNLIILICDKCYKKKEQNINEIIKYLQEKTKYNNLKKNHNYCIVNEGKIEKNWFINNKFLFFEIKNNSIYVPLIKENEEKLINLRHLTIMNDLVF